MEVQKGHMLDAMSQHEVRHMSLVQLANTVAVWKSFWLKIGSDFIDNWLSNMIR